MIVIITLTFIFFALILHSFQRNLKRHRFILTTMTSISMLHLVYLNKMQSLKQHHNRIFKLTFSSKHKFYDRKESSLTKKDSRQLLKNVYLINTKATPQNAKIHSNNLAATCQWIDFVWTFCGVGTLRVKITLMGKI